MKISIRLLSITVLLSLFTGTPVNADVQPHAGMLRYPDISSDRIVFSYANDLWTVSRDGGTAQPLASPAGREWRPRFSPDGTRIAFTGNYDGNNDLYIIPAEGGMAQRVTHHPGREYFNDWSGDDTLLFAAVDYQGLGQSYKLYLVDHEGGMPEELPVPYGQAAAIDGSGSLLAYSPHSRDGRTWKRYRGGMASDLWFFDLNTYDAKRITDWEGTDTQPMWHDGILYYLSDAGSNHRLNIWSYDPATEARRQLTDYADYDVLWPSMGPGTDGKGEIIFQNGTRLLVMDLPTEAVREVKVRIPGDRPNVRHRRIKTSDEITNYGISPSGARAVVEARGDIWTLPAKNGLARNLTNTDGIAERDPAWSPDGRWVAYFSDASGEYEIHLQQSDGKGETRQLTSGGTPFKYAPRWSPDSKKILYTEKSGEMFLIDVADGSTVSVDVDPYAQVASTNFSPDSRWIAYDRMDKDNEMSSIWIYDIENDTRHRITSPMFNDANPSFDRDGDYLYFTSGRTFRPEYSPVDGTFIYTAPGNLYALPLREDVDPMWAIEIDEEEWEEEEEEGDEETEDGDAEEDDADESGDDSDASDDSDADKEDETDETGFALRPRGGFESVFLLVDDPISGTWSGSVEVVGAPGEVPPINFVMELEMAEDYGVTGTVEIDMIGSRDLEGDWNPDSSVLSLSSDDEEPTLFEIDGNSMTGSREEEGMKMIMTATRQGTEDEADDDEGSKKDKKSSKKKDEIDPIEIDFTDIESRAVRLPVGTGMFGQTAVNDRGQVLFIKDGDLMSYDISDADDKGSEVASGVGGFELTPDGKKLAHRRGGGVGIRKAGSGGSSDSASTRGMVVVIDPRMEWEQIFNEVWRVFRDYFYVENMHGVDWEGVREQYAAMLPDVVTREDLNYVIGEMIAELNVGHAYRGGGDMEGGGASVNVGLLAADFELSDGAYRIARIHEGGPWDDDARGPLSMPGVDVSEGDWILAVNGEMIDPEHDPHQAFIGTANQITVLTVNDKPEIDDDAREIVLKPLRNDGYIRYRAWIERNRRHVEEATDGQVGYIYVPDTGVNGQNDLYRQFYGQSGKAALIIDERWNGGGQIPWRFIELLNRPATNYFALRDGEDWKIPSQSHNGPKCMLINGRAGSGGDMFPWLFKQAGLGKLIGTRTWGGLVGISGNPGPIDGGYIRVPRFGFYELDGTWGIEGHGVDPDIEVIDHPALMMDGGDPQLDRAIEQMLMELETGRYVPPVRPADPDRSGMGLPLDEY
ncbi:MAG: hypothetical protein CMJ24_06830 [Phycisphaerae bacterium]|nr:hypothetical protein [Phycisphaerae bacterium]